MNYEELQIVAQLVKAMEDTYAKMEASYSKKDIAGFKEAKDAILNFQRQIAQLLTNIEEGKR
jgi:hypothetical protein